MRFGTTILAFIPVVALGAGALRARADDAGATMPKDAFERASKVRAALPAPVEPEEGKPGVDFKYEGDLVQTGENSGSLTYRIDIGTFRDEPIWLVNEEKIDDFGGSHTATESVLYLKPDLSLLKGEWMRTTADERIRLTFVRGGDGFDVTREITKGTAEAVVSKKHIPAAADATFGRGALLIFLRHVPAAAADYALPLVPLDAAIPSVNEHEVPVAIEPLRIEVVGGAKFGEGKGVRDSWMARLRHGRYVSEAHLSPPTRDLLGIEERMPPGIKSVPKGQGGVKPVYEDDKPARSWKGAFLKFGHGYHLAVSRWIEGAIHWETMLKHEIEIGGVTQDTVLDDFKRAYLAEFLAKSKHRPREQADSLLRMTIATAEEREEKDGGMVLATSPEFGGNVYHFKAVDGVWYLVRIDQ